MKYLILILSFMACGCKDEFVPHRYESPPPKKFRDQSTQADFRDPSPPKKQSKEVACGESIGQHDCSTQTTRERQNEIFLDLCIQALEHPFARDSDFLEGEINLLMRNWESESMMKFDWTLTTHFSPRYNRDFYDLLKLIDQMYEERLRERE